MSFGNRRNASLAGPQSLLLESAPHRKLQRYLSALAVLRALPIRYRCCSVRMKIAPSSTA